MVTNGFDGRLDFACQGIDFADPFDFISKQFHADGEIFFIGGENIQNISPDPKGGAREIIIIAFVLHFDKMQQQIIAPAGLPDG